MSASQNSLITGFEEYATDILMSARSRELNTRNELREQIMVRGSEQADLTQKARDARKSTGDDHLIARASIEFSNYCRQKCSFCGMTATNKQLQRYRMDVEQMSHIIKDVSALGVSDLHLASGEDWAFKADALAPIIREAVAEGMEVTLVTGHRTVDDYALWKEAGASRYILKVETTNPQLFEEARTGTELTLRVSHLLYLRQMGYKIGSGIISGIPKQTTDDLVDDLMFMKELKPDMASVSRFLPNSQSRYANTPEGDPDTSLNFLSLLRTEMSQPDLRIPAGTSLGRRQIDAIHHGANVVSLHVTPDEYADLYSSYRAENRISTKMDSIRKFAQVTGMPLRLKQQV